MMDCRTCHLSETCTESEVVTISTGKSIHALVEVPDSIDNVNWPLVAWVLVGVALFTVFIISLLSN